MTEFLMIFRSPYTPDVTPTTEQLEEGVKQWQDWMGSIAAQGKFVATSRLSSVGSKTLRPNNVTTDGPYVEAKEIVGGSLLVKVADMDEAVNLAKTCPVFNMGGNVEIRAIIPMGN
jgi:hypothetical protein